jgi:hypothetical protein
MLTIPAKAVLSIARPPSEFIVLEGLDAWPAKSTFVDAP